jgi:hypothetical protein
MAEAREMATTTAVAMAKQVGVDPKVFRQGLREQTFPWHSHNERRKVEVGSEQQEAMERVLREIRS